MRSTSSVSNRSSSLRPVPLQPLTVWVPLPPRDVWSRDRFPNAPIASAPHFQGNLSRIHTVENEKLDWLFSLPFSPSHNVSLVVDPTDFAGSYAKHCPFMNSQPEMKQIVASNQRIQIVFYAFRTPLDIEKYRDTLPYDELYASQPSTILKQINELQLIRPSLVIPLIMSNNYYNVVQSWREQNVDVYFPNEALRHSMPVDDGDHLGSIFHSFRNKTTHCDRFSPTAIKLFHALEACCLAIDKEIVRAIEKHPKTSSSGTIPVGIAVHCTHGFNRTGLLISYWFMTRARKGAMGDVTRANVLRTFLNKRGVIRDGSGRELIGRMAGFWGQNDLNTPQFANQLCDTQESAAAKQFKYTTLLQSLHTALYPPSLVSHGASVDRSSAPVESQPSTLRSIYRNSSIARRGSAIAGAEKEIETSSSSAVQPQQRSEAAEAPMSSFVTASADPESVHTESGIIESRVIVGSGAHDATSNDEVMQSNDANPSPADALSSSEEPLALEEVDVLNALSTSPSQSTFEDDFPDIDDESFIDDGSLMSVATHSTDLVTEMNKKFDALKKFSGIYSRLTQHRMSMKVASQLAAEASSSSSSNSSSVYLSFAQSYGPSTLISIVLELHRMFGTLRKTLEREQATHVNLRYSNVAEILREHAHQVQKIQEALLDSLNEMICVFGGSRMGKSTFLENFIALADTFASMLTQFMSHIDEYRSMKSNATRIDPSLIQSPLCDGGIQTTLYKRQRMFRKPVASSDAVLEMDADRVMMESNSLNSNSLSLDAASPTFTATSSSSSSANSSSHEIHLPLDSSKQYTLDPKNEEEGGEFQPSIALAIRSGGASSTAITTLIRAPLLLRGEEPFQCIFGGISKRELIHALSIQEKALSSADHKEEKDNDAAKQALLQRARSICGLPVDIEPTLEQLTVPTFLNEFLDNDVLSSPMLELFESNQFTEVERQILRSGARDSTVPGFAALRERFHFLILNRLREEQIQLAAGKHCGILDECQLLIGIPGLQHGGSLADQPGVKRGDFLKTSQIALRSAQSLGLILFFDSSGKLDETQHDVFRRVLGLWFNRILIVWRSEPEQSLENLTKSRFKILSLITPRIGEQYFRSVKPGAADSRRPVRKEIIKQLNESVEEAYKFLTQQTSGDAVDLIRLDAIKQYFSIHVSDQTVLEENDKRNRPMSGESFRSYTFLAVKTQVLELDAMHLSNDAIESLMACESWIEELFATRVSENLRNVLTAADSVIRNLLMSLEYNVTHSRASAEVRRLAGELMTKRTPEMKLEMEDHLKSQLSSWRKKMKAEFKTLMERKRFNDVLNASWTDAANIRKAVKELLENPDHPPPASKTRSRQGSRALVDSSSDAMQQLSSAIQDALGGLLLTPLLLVCDELQNRFNFSQFSDLADRLSACFRFDELPNDPATAAGANEAKAQNISRQALVYHARVLQSKIRTMIKGSLQVSQGFSIDALIFAARNIISKHTEDAMKHINSLLSEARGTEKLPDYKEEEAAQKRKQRELETRINFHLCQMNHQIVTQLTTELTAMFHTFIKQLTEAKILQVETEYFKTLQELVNSQPSHATITRLETIFDAIKVPSKAVQSYIRTSLEQYNAQLLAHQSGSLEANGAASMLVEPSESMDPLDSSLAPNGALAAAGLMGPDEGSLPSSSLPPGSAQPTPARAAAAANQTTPATNQSTYASRRPKRNVRNPVSLASALEHTSSAPTPRAVAAAVGKRAPRNIDFKFDVAKLIVDALHEKLMRREITCDDIERLSLNTERSEKIGADLCDVLSNRFPTKVIDSKFIRGRFIYLYNSFRTQLSNKTKMSAEVTFKYLRDFFQNPHNSDDFRGGQALFAHNLRRHKAQLQQLAVEFYIRMVNYQNQLEWIRSRTSSSSAADEKRKENGNEQKPTAKEPESDCSSSCSAVRSTEFLELKDYIAMFQNMPWDWLALGSETTSDIDCYAIPNPNNPNRFFTFTQYCRYRQLSKAFDKSYVKSLLSILHSEMAGSTTWTPPEEMMKIALDKVKHKVMKELDRATRVKSEAEDEAMEPNHQEKSVKARSGRKRGAAEEANDAEASKPRKRGRFSAGYGVKVEDSKTVEKEEEKQEEEEEKEEEKEDEVSSDTEDSVTEDDTDSDPDYIPPSDSDQEEDNDPDFDG